MPMVVPPAQVQSPSAQFQPGGAVFSRAPVAYSVTATDAAGVHGSTAWSVTGSSTTTRRSRPSSVSPLQYIAAANDAPLENPSTITFSQPATACSTMDRAAAYWSSGKYSHCLAPHPSAFPVGEMTVTSPSVV